MLANKSNTRMLTYAGIAIVLLLLALLGIVVLVWGWPPSFEVKGVEIQTAP
jgi:Na+-transporting methylmalonyl-CoA/oxaloacetate decarboxylase gamma subunit